MSTLTKIRFINSIASAIPFALLVVYVFVAFPPSLESLGAVIPTVVFISFIGFVLSPHMKDYWIISRHFSTGDWILVWFFTTGSVVISMLIFLYCIAFPGDTLVGSLAIHVTIVGVPVAKRLLYFLYGIELGLLSYINSLLPYKYRYYLK